MFDPQSDFPEEYEVEVYKIFKYTVRVDACNQQEAGRKAIEEVKANEGDYWEETYECMSVNYYEPTPDLD
jgi:hypothetical protein